MSQPVTIENDALRMEVWPQFGGKVSSLVDKADGYELMFNFPAELPAGPQYDASYVRGWCAGWDECFPAVSPGKYNRHPYDGIAVPDHGEVWGLPTTSVPTNNGITTVWHGLRFGYRLTRKLRLEGSSVVAEYALFNLAPFDFYFAWAQHPMLAMGGAIEIDLPAGELFRWSHDADLTEINTRFQWPAAGEGMDLSRPHALPRRAGWKVFSEAPISAPLRLRYPTRGRGLTVEFSADEKLQAYWGLWINTGGWAGHHHVCPQPTTGRFDQIDRAILDGSAGRVGPLGRRDWVVRWAVG